MDKKKNKIQLECEKKISELMNDLQRTRADFENYQKRTENEKAMAREYGQAAAILKLIPVIDDIERAVAHIPDEFKDNQWAQGISGLVKNLDKSLEALNLKKIDAKPGTKFNPELHDAVQFDETVDSNSTDGEDVVTEELQPGYLLGDKPIRHAMVRVTKH